VTATGAGTTSISGGAGGGATGENVCAGGEIGIGGGAGRCGAAGVSGAGAGAGVKRAAGGINFISSGSGPPAGEFTYGLCILFTGAGAGTGAVAVADWFGADAGTGDEAAGCTCGLGAEAGAGAAGLNKCWGGTGACVPVWGPAALLKNTESPSVFFCSPDR